MSYAPPKINAPPSPATPIILICNQFKSCNIIGYLPFSDYVIDGVTTIGKILSVRDILANGNYLFHGITTLSGLISLFYNNITTSGLICYNNITTSSIVCYRNTFISGSIYMNKDNNIYYNNAGI